MPQSQASTIHLLDSETYSNGKVTYLLFFITGNPGLIEYYRTFLSHLYALLSASHQGINFQVFGRSLSGFDVSDSLARKHGINKESGDQDGPPYGLQAQIEGTERALEALVKAESQKCRGDVRVILMGHSVGAFILLEIIRRHRERLRSEKDLFRIEGGVCLFPTVTHIMKSQSGKRAGFLLCLSHFALIASLLAKTLTFWIPTSILSFLIQKFMSFPPNAAVTTASFIRSQTGIRQALHMARDEMKVITNDTWDSEIWGAAEPTSSTHLRPVLRFLFGSSDHWVADETRDELIKVRGATGNGDLWRPKMDVDEVEGWPHGFCIKHSIPVAERVKSYIEEMVGRVTSR